MGKSRKHILEKIIKELEGAQAHPEDYDLNTLLSDITSATRQLRAYKSYSSGHQHLLALISDSLEHTLNKYKVKPKTKQIGAIIDAFKYMKKEMITSYDLEHVASYFAKEKIFTIP